MTIASFIKFAAVLIAALLLGRWFDKERKISRMKGQPWFTPWRSTPGIVIIIVLILLIVLRIYLTIK